jgi:metallophosphoesterase superfamily enzyme
VPLDRGRFAPKLPCFHVGERVGVLPAFTRFAAGGVLRRRAGDRVFVVGEGRVEQV